MNKKQFKIGIIGEMRSGKDTVAKIIKELTKHENKTINFAFSEGIHVVLNMLMPEVYEEGKPRKELQEVGQFMRQIKPDVWIDYLFNTLGYEWANKRGYNMILTDVRQPNEVARLREQGYTILRVQAPVDVRVKRILEQGDAFEPSSLTHDTEKSVAFLSADYQITNDGSLEDLKDKVATFLDVVRGGVI